MDKKKASKKHDFANTMLIKILYGIDYGLQKIKILHEFSTHIHNKQGLYSLEFFADG